MAIAVCAWPAAALAARASERFGARRALGGTLAFAAVLPVSLFLVPAGTTSAMAVYVVSGLIGSIVVPQFWTLAGKVLTVAQGRRLFGLIAAAGVLGGVLGSGTAAAVLIVLPVRALLLVSAAAFVLAGTALLRVGGDERVDPRGSRVARTMTDSARTFRDQPLLTRIGVSVVISTATLLVLDYCFKSTLARSLPGPQIGPFVARYYLAAQRAVPGRAGLSGQRDRATARRHGGHRADPAIAAARRGRSRRCRRRDGRRAGHEGDRRRPSLLDSSHHGGAHLPARAGAGFVSTSSHSSTARWRARPRPSRGRPCSSLGGTWVLAPRPLAVVVTVLAGAWLAIAVTMRRPYLALLRRAISTGSAAHAGQSRAPGSRERAAPRSAPRQRGPARGHRAP